MDTLGLVARKGLLVISVPSWEDESLLLHNHRTALQGDLPIHRHSAGNSIWISALFCCELWIPKVSSGHGYLQKVTRCLTTLCCTRALSLILAIILWLRLFMSPFLGKIIWGYDIQDATELGFWTQAYSLRACGVMSLTQTWSLDGDSQFSNWNFLH
jgi:hypothetical protein